MKRQLLPFFVTIGGLLAVFSVVLLFSTEPAAARQIEANVDEPVIFDFEAGQRSRFDEPSAGAQVHRPQLEQRQMVASFSAVDPYPVEGLEMHVNYAEDYVEGMSDFDATVAITVTSHDGSYKADALVSAEADGFFFVSCNDWAGDCPDIVPGAGQG